MSNIYNVLGGITMLLDPSSIIAIQRILIALIIGGVIGLDREAKKRSAGFKTYSMVCMASALVMLIGEYIFINFNQSGDIARLGAQVISGVGFLGVGTIVTSKNQKVKGLTTAAGLWTCACIGLAIGIGYILGGVIVGIVVLILLRLLKFVDRVVRRNVHFADVYLEIHDAKTVSIVTTTINDFKGVDIIFLESVNPKVGNYQIGINIILKLNKGLTSSIILERINAMKEVGFAHTIYA